MWVRTKTNAVYVLCDFTSAFCPTSLYKLFRASQTEAKNRGVSILALTVVSSIISSPPRFLVTAPSSANVLLRKCSTFCSRPAGCRPASPSQRAHDGRRQTRPATSEAFNFISQQVRDYLLLTKKLGIPPLLSSCSSHSARFPPAQAELGRLSNIPEISKQNL